MEVLRTYGLSKKYKEKVVLDGVSISIDSGDIYGLVGENGAGKTTLIRLICGLINETNGNYSLFGVKKGEKGFTASQNKIGGIVESVSLIKSMTALENMRFQALITHSNKTDEELIELIDRVGLNYEEIKNKKAGNFSLGMSQRLGIAIIMVSDPEFIILDEPMNGVDPQGIIDIRNTITKLNSEGVTFLISSHILAELEKICTKIGMLSHGKLVSEFNLEEFHKNSRKRTILKCMNESDNEKVVKLLMEELNLKEVHIDNNSVVVYDEININDIIKFLVNNNIIIENFNVINDTIEDYYIKMIGRGE